MFLPMWPGSMVNRNQSSTDLALEPSDSISLDQTYVFNPSLGSLVFTPKCCLPGRAGELMTMSAGHCSHKTGGRPSAADRASTGPRSHSLGR